MRFSRKPDDTVPPPPDYDAGAPSDWWGAEAIPVMLADVPFPTTADLLLARTRDWRVPLRGAAETVALGDLLAGVEASRAFGSPADVVDEVRRRHHGY